MHEHFDRWSTPVDNFATPKDNGDAECARYQGRAAGLRCLRRSA